MLSPIGVLYISIEIEKVAEKFNNEFPSPIGVLYISLMPDIIQRTEQGVSVPYWGSLYFTSINISKKNMIEFPSPIGVLYISIDKEIDNKEFVDRVSVPYWGSLYFNYPPQPL